MGFIKGKLMFNSIKKKTETMCFSNRHTFPRIYVWTEFLMKKTPQKLDRRHNEKYHVATVEKIPPVHIEAKGFS